MSKLKLLRYFWVFVMCIFECIAADENVSERGCLRISANKVVKKSADFEKFICWSHLEWQFPSPSAEHSFFKKYGEYWKKAMPAGFKIDSNGNYYISVPRWNAGIPATLNKLVKKNGKWLLEAFPSWNLNKEGDLNALQSVLGYEIDKNGIMWILDQGHVQGKVSMDGSQKLLAYDLEKEKIIFNEKIPNKIASYKSSFLNDLVIDDKNKFIYITDSGVMADPLEPAIIVYDIKNHKFRRVLHQHFSVLDQPGFWFMINGKKIWSGKPMRTGVDGIALSADKQTLYWTPLTSRKLYAINTKFLRDFNISQNTINNAVVEIADKGTNSDGMVADNQGKIWFTMLEKNGIGYYNPVGGVVNYFAWDKDMVWVDGIAFDNQGMIYFNSNQLHNIYEEKLDWSMTDNFVIWRVKAPNNEKSYLYID